MKKTIKTFTIKLLIFVTTFVIVDFGVGIACSLIRENVLNHNSYHLNQKTPFIVDKVEAEMVIVGASDASHYYIPHFIADSLNMSVYNCGQV